MSVNYISADGFAAKVSAGDAMHIIDVRTGVEFGACHIRGAKLHPLQSLDPKAVVAEAAGAPIHILCKGGARAKKAAEQISSDTGQTVWVVSGGTDACVNINMPHNVGKEVMSLERQVRIAAGSLVVVGVAAGALLHPAFFGLSGFVGAGLVFAGVTDTCAMGMMLARMPWNKADENNLSEASA